MMSTITNPKEKKLSKCWRGFKKLKPNPKIAPKSIATATATATATEATPPTEAQRLIRLIDEDLDEMQRGAGRLQAAKDRLTRYHDMLDGYLIKLEAIFKKIKDDDKKVEKLNRLRKKLVKMRAEIPFVVFRNQRPPRRVIPVPEELIPQLHGSLAFKRSMEFNDFVVRYRELEDRLKLCLLCFSIFPKGATVKKRLMVQWWIVEGFVSTEEDAETYLKMLVEKGFVEDVEGGSCGILHPFHRWVVVALAERANLFKFGRRGDPTQSFSGSLQACLVGKGLTSYEDHQTRCMKQGKGAEACNKVFEEVSKELEKLHLLMNVDEHILEFEDEWFPRMKNLNILYLGRWKAATTDHIKLGDPKVLEGLGKMKFVKFLSLQGVSNLISLPESIRHLTNLEVLDLRACSNLKCIPEGICLLQKLRHLDMSECSQLTHMPKGLSELTNLKVLKGFLVTKYNDESCTLGDLKRLERLEKLCIYTDWEDFPGKEHILDLERLVSLTKLTITWRHRTRLLELAMPLPLPMPPVEQGRLPRKLEKLDLKCFPMAHIPDWLKPENMEHIKLKKLYIRGGQLRDLGQYQRDIKWWSVEELRLNYLDKMEMEWRELRGLFPKLKYVEKVKCPKLTLFPCDAKGVWRSTQEQVLVSFPFH